MIRYLAVALLLGIITVPVTAQKKTGGNESSVKVLLVITNHGRMGDTDKPTGYWLSEVSHAWTRFVDAGYDVVFASPDGGPVPADPRSIKLDDPENKRMWEKRPIMEKLGATESLASIDPSQYNAVYFAGGHGAMWDFPDSEALQSVTRDIYQNGGVVSAVCHGPAALVDVKTSAGEYLVAGKRIATFTNAEETSSGFTSVVPFLLQTKLEERGAIVKTAPNFEKNVIVDGRLVTGQNPASAGEVAETVIKLLSARQTEK